MTTNLSTRTNSSTLKVIANFNNQAKHQHYNSGLPQSSTNKLSKDRLRKNEFIKIDGVELF